MQNKYVDFIKDEDFMECVAYLYEGYALAYKNKDLKDFIKNKIDPVKAIGDYSYLGLTMKEIVQREVIRQADRAVSNRIGLFHERVIGTLKGYQQLPAGKGVDVQSTNKQMVVEVKNKHNTVKGSDQITIFKALLEQIENPNTPVEEGYYVRITDTKSHLEPWVLTHKGKVYHHEKIFIASADQFYWHLTGKKEAFRELIFALPKAAKDYRMKMGLTAEGLQQSPKALLDDEYRLLNDEEMLLALIRENYKHYVGF